MKNIFKKLLIISLMLIVIIKIDNVKASQSAPYSPQNFEIVIKNINKNEIDTIDIIYKTQYSFYYGDEYSNDIVNYPVDRIDEIAIKILNLSEPAVSEMKKSGYWLELDHGSYGELKEEKNSKYLVKWLINSEVTKKYDGNKLIITFPTFHNSEQKNLSDVNSYMLIKKKDGTVLYSKNIASKLTKFFDEHSSEEEIKEAEALLDIEAAYFEVDYRNIENNFEVVEVYKEDEDKNEKNISTILVSTVSISAFAIIVLIAKFVYIPKIKKRKLQ